MRSSRYPRVDGIVGIGYDADRMNDLSAEEIIAKLNLDPLPGEGGFFRRTYLSNSFFKPDLSSAPPRASGSAIYFLLTDAKDGLSRFHYVDGDEIYHFYGGGTAELHLFSSFRDDSLPLGYKKIILGNDLLKGEMCQYVVPAGTIQGLIPSAGVPWVLLGTTMSPAFEDRGFELVDREKLTLFYPKQEEIFKKFYKRR